MSYEFSYGSTSFRLRNKKAIEKWLSHCFKTEKVKFSIVHYHFCSVKEMLKINKQFLNHNFHTDVITFDYTSEKIVSADVYVSPDTVSYNAKLNAVSSANEMRRVLLHAVLHLCGYGDKTKVQQRTMREREDFYLLLWPRFSKG